MSAHSTTLTRRTRTTPSTKPRWTRPLPPSTADDIFPSTETTMESTTIPITETTTTEPPTSTLPPTTTTTTEPPTITTTTTTSSTTTTLSTSPSTTRTRTTRTRTSTSTSTNTSTSTTSSLLPPTTTTGPTISPTEPPSDDTGNHLSTGAIVGIAVGALAAIVALTALAMFASRRRRRERNRISNLMYNPMAPDMREGRGGRGGGGGGGGGSGSGSGATGSYGQMRAADNGNQIPAAQALSMGSASLLGESHISQRSSNGMGNESDILVGGGGAAAMGAAYGGYEANRRHQMQQQQMYQEAGGGAGDYSPNQQRISYTPPTAPGMSDEERYNPEYATQREQEVAEYNQYQQYLADQEWRQAAAMAAGGVSGGAAGAYYGGPSQQQQAEYGAQAGGYYPDQQQYSGDQLQHLQQLRYGPERGSGPGGTSSPSRVTPGVTASYPAVPPSNSGQFDYVYGGQQLPGAGSVAPYPPAISAVSMDDYATPESDARFTKSEPWPEVPPPSSNVGDVPMVTIATAPIPVPTAEDSTAVDNSKRNSQFSAVSSSGSNSGLPRRVNSPQLIPPSPKRAPQVLYPENEPSFSAP